jgi:hypothetical protein
VSDCRFQGAEEYELRLVARPPDVPPAVRLRRALKALARAYGFRATSVRDVTPYPDGAPGVAQDGLRGVRAEEGPFPASGAPDADEH